MERLPHTDALLHELWLRSKWSSEGPENEQKLERDTRSRRLFRRLLTTDFAEDVDAGG